MKTNTILIGLVLLIASSITSSAQVAGFVPMDETMQNLIDFYNTDTIVVVTPNGYQVNEDDKKSIESYAFWMENLSYIYKQESALKPVDHEKHLQFFGPAFMFETNILAATPFNPENDGFSYQGRKFIEPEDSFFYMNSNATNIFTCRNSEKYPLAYKEFLAGGVYQLYIFSGYSILISGFDKHNGAPPSINNMDDLRKRYFNHNVSSQFFDLHFANSYPMINSDSLARELDLFVADFCDFLAVDTVGIPRITTYIYSSREDLQSFIAANNRQTIYGKSFGNLNHIMSFDLSIFKHEAGHSIIGAKVGKNTNPFFDEGFRQYTDYLFSSQAYEKDLEIFKEHSDFLITDLVISNDNSFFNSMINYSISGVFVKHIIDVIGIEKFKMAYAQNSVNKEIENRIGTLAEVIKAFKTTIDQ